MEIIINNKTIEVNRELTVLEAAEENGIYIPKMCAHPELVPYGGCRLCIVEIEGRKGYPTSCTTLVEDGMIVRTDSNILQEMRINLVQLILSEHPSACLLCEDIDGCSLFQETIRKVGVTTGCRWCPKDKDCELQRVVESFGISELSLPGLYRDLPVEKYDPFFDRDYNLCIYCGRCVRICDEYRKSSVLALRQRGKHTTIGPSFDDNHTDAGCEYCGACVSVCPTGAMSEKSRKWWGNPDTYTSSVCPLCSINCEIQVLSLHNKIVGTIPPGNPHETAGELCVKGRFCLSEIVNRTERILEPQFRYPEGYGIVQWDEAIAKGSELLNATLPGRSAVFLSPDLSLEEYQAAKIFSEKVLKTDEITSSRLDSKQIACTKLAFDSVPLEKVKKADLIISFFLNGNYNYGPLTMAVKEAASSNIPYYQIGWIKDTTSRFARHNIIPAPGDEVKILDKIIECLENGTCDNDVIRELSDQLREIGNTVLIVGPWILSLTNFTIILDRIRKIISITGSKLYMPDPYGNLKGMLASVALKPLESVIEKINRGEIDLMYLIGDIPISARKKVKHVFYQSAFPAPEDLIPDVILPSTLWGERGGTWAGKNGSTVMLKQVAKAHDYALSHIEIFTRFASASKVKGANAAIKSKSGKVPVKLKPKMPDEFALASVRTTLVSPGKKLPFVIVQEKSPHVYMNLDLSIGIDGFSELVKPGHVQINVSDAKEMEIKDGDSVHISNARTEKTYQVVARKNIHRGVAYLTILNERSDFKCNPCYVNIRRADV